MALSLFDQEINLHRLNCKKIELQSLVEVRDGTHDSPKNTSDGYPLVTSKHIKGNSIDFSTTKKISKFDYLNINQRSKVDIGDILISMIGTVGIVHLVRNMDLKYAIKNIGLIKTSVDNQFKYLIYLSMLSQYGQDYVKQHLAGSTQQYLSLTELRKFQIPMLPEEKLEMFNDTVIPIFNEISSLSDQILWLTELRDTLLPKLLNGEIDLSN
ncbi:MAG: restriction endonuclease subunit S [Lactobacillaceae bacterium]|nr:restriction endonuclease subunit S [Lactobacillaceae bacterium]